jgi:aspartyl-tRNA(Asn)/glutamyl-tRNA(Gln) amidotransferase subunit A
MAILSRRTFLAASAASALPLRGQPEDPAAWTLAQAAAAIRGRSIRPTGLVEACLRRIDVYNPKLNAFITVLRAQALAAAREAERELAAGRSRGPLHGIPIALKDNIDTAGVRTTAASAVYADRVPAEDAEVARRLKEAGAILIGKTNLHEFANGGTNAASYFGPVRNPWALDRHPGGSSGGSAAAVAAGLCYGALGTDTGGSIRTPACFCSIVGLKPTYGLVSIRGIIPLVWSLDHCGPMTRTVEDAALLLQALAGYDRLDIASVERPPADYAAALRQPVSGLRVGVARVPFFDHLEDDIAAAVEEAIRVIARMTRETRDALLPATRAAQLDGEMYAYHKELFEQSAPLYQIPTRRNLQRGAEARAAAYVRGWREVQLLRRTVADAFREVDVVVLPTRRRTPRTIEAAIQREETERARNPEMENTGAFNVLGLPAISVPCGFTKAGLPVGLMIAGPPFAEDRVLALAHAYERATEWHTRQPPLRPDTPVPPLRREDG